LEPWVRANLKYLLLDGFDPDTGELALRASLAVEDGSAPDMLRLKLFLGHKEDPIQPLRRELQTHVQMPIPLLWDKGLKIIIRAIEDELDTPQGREPLRYAWVQTQILHPTEEKRGTLNHPVHRQVEVLWDWAQRLDQEGDTIRAMELLERLLLLAPQHVPALTWMGSLLREQGMVTEALSVADRLLRAQPDNVEAKLRRGEALLHLERHQEAQRTFAGILKTNPVHLLAHLGAAQARSYGGSDPCPHLDAALELNRPATLSVLRETFDCRILVNIPGETRYPLEDLPAMLGVTAGEVRTFAGKNLLPMRNESVRESELARWVLLQNRYQLLQTAIHWLAPTPRQIPELP
jgi:tetratricopeptide (TPR) repeat protein